MTTLRALVGCLCLAAPAAAAEPPPVFAPKAEIVWSDASTNLLGAPSLDGRFLSFVDPATGDLAAYEIATGHRRRLTRNQPDAKTFAYFSTVSPDSRRVAYAWFNERKFYELRLIDASGGESKLLYSNPEIGFVQPCDFSPDGRQILTLFFRKDNVSQIALVSAEDGSVQVLKTLSWFYPKRISFSPDGRYILYDSIVSRDSAARDILLLRADGSAETKLIDDEANDIFPVWAPDGAHIIFASNRSGDMDLFLQDFANGEAVGQPRPIARSLGRALPMGVTRDGLYYYGLRAGGSDVYVSGFSDDGVAGQPERVGRTTVSRSTAPAWSPDGKNLAYLTQLGTENYGQESRGIVIWSLADRTERLALPQMAFVSQLEYSPDGQQLLASGSDGKGRAGLFQVRVDDGSTRPLVSEHGGDPRGFEGVWSADGELVYYLNGSGAMHRYALADRRDEELFAPESGATLHSLARSPDGAKLAFAQRPGDAASGDALIVYEIAGGERRELMRLRNAPLSGVEWARDGRNLWVSAPAAPAPKLWKVPLNGEAPREIPWTAAREGGIRLSPDGRRVAYSANDQHSEVWTLRDWLPKSAAAEPQP
ncbi:MAG: hypothetical protein GC160_14555 [Acidobacteria bacterium]|nr:hypothetical protein [Acidobacteriota bacterium]